MAKKSTKRAAAAPASKAASVSVGGNSFKGAIHVRGKLYDGSKKADVEALSKLVASQKVKPESLQRLADKGRLSGFGTKAGRKAKGSEEEGEVSPEANAVAGGGVTATEEPAE
jgi:hypothetical protein